MVPNSPNPEGGRRLRAARERLGLSTRDVERLSRALAEGKQNQEYYISHAWLSQIERGELTPGIFKIYTLSTIYQQRLDHVLAFFGIPLADIGRDQIQQPLPNTQLVSASELSPGAAPTVLDGASLEKTDLVTRIFSGLGKANSDLFPHGAGSSFVYGYIGAKDFTLFPLIRPGAFVEIDSSQRRIESTKSASLFERPIYFVELRDGYACSWCEQTDGRLLMIPSHQSGYRVREVRYPSGAEVIGRVTAVTMRIVGPKEKRAGTTVPS